jgi:hypothetical protein
MSSPAQPRKPLPSARVEASLEQAEQPASNKNYTQVGWAAVPGSRGIGFAAAEN